jgi:transcriptional regulator with XRE-family HTH domain
MIRESILKAIKGQKMSGKELSERAGIKRPQAVTDFLNGKQWINEKNLENICKVLNLVLL